MEKTPTEISRRGLLCGVAALTLGFVPDIANAAEIEAKIANGKITIDLAKNKGVDKVGGVIVASLFDGNMGTGVKVALVRTAAGTKGLSALDLTCTHENYQVEPAKGGFICPNHLAKFSTAGKVTQGPANTPLKKLPVALVGKKATITLA